MVGNPSAGTDWVSWHWHNMSDVSRLMTDLVCGRISHGNAVCSCRRLLPSQAELRCYTTAFNEYECLMYLWYSLSLVSHDVAGILERSVVFMWTRRRRCSRMAHLAFQVLSAYTGLRPPSGTQPPLGTSVDCKHNRSSQLPYPCLRLC